ncbi:MAG: hypothetical protein GXZ05_09590 [Gammaproteobacteria bacterium]|nr:hypothetical protein [Gammaproteobacteria bacterium]
MNNQNVLAAAPDHIADARKMVRGEPASGVVLSRDDLIQCLLATRGQSEGITADAILSVIAAAPAVQGKPAPQSPPDDPLGGLEHRADGEPNFYTLSRPTGNWVARIQFNGELHTHEQERILNAMLGDRNVRYGDGYHQGYWDARQDSPDVSALVEALEAAHQFITNGVALGCIQMPDADTPDPAHGTLPSIEAPLAAHRKQGAQP